MVGTHMHIHMGTGQCLSLAVWTEWKDCLMMRHLRWVSLLVRIVIMILVVVLLSGWKSVLASL